MSLILLVNLIGVAISWVSAPMVLYKLLPHRKLMKSRPAVEFFPKYVFPAGGEASIEMLGLLGFQRYKGTNAFVKGPILGGPSSKYYRRSITVVDGTMYLQSPFIGIFFDTGDLWAIGRQIQDASKTSLICFIGRLKIGRGITTIQPQINLGSTYHPAKLAIPCKPLMPQAGLL